MKHISNLKLAIFIVLFSVWLCVEFLIFGKFSMIRMFDMGDHHLPYAISVSKNIQEFGFFFMEQKYQIRC